MKESFCGIFLDQSFQLYHLYCLNSQFWKLLAEFLYLSSILLLDLTKLYFFLMASCFKRLTFLREWPTSYHSRVLCLAFFSSYLHFSEYLYWAQFSLAHFFIVLLKYQFFSWTAAGWFACFQCTLIGPQTFNRHLKVGTSFYCFLQSQFIHQHCQRFPHHGLDFMCIQIWQGLMTELLKFSRLLILRFPIKIRLILRIFPLMVIFPLFTILEAHALVKFVQVLV